MEFSALCPHCSRPIGLATGEVGRVSTCPACGKEFTVPDPGVATGPDEPGAAASWFLSSDGTTRHGPYSEAQMKQFVAQKGISEQSLVWKEGWPEWKQLRQVTELLGLGARLAQRGSSRSPSTSGAPRRYRNSRLSLALRCLLLFLGSGGLSLASWLLFQRITGDEARHPIEALPHEDGPSPPREDSVPPESPLYVPATPDEVAGIVRKGRRTVARSFEEARLGIAVSDTPRELFVRALATAREKDLYVSHPSHEVERLRTDQERIEALLEGATSDPGAVDLVLVSRLGLCADEAFRDAFEGHLAPEAAWSLHRPEAQGFLELRGVPVDAVRRAFQEETPYGDIRRVYLFYFYYRLATISRTIALLSDRGISEGELYRALGEAPTRKAIALPEIPDLVRPPDREFLPPGLEGSQDTPGEVGPGPIETPGEPPIEVAKGLDFEAIRGYVRDADLDAGRRVALALIGKSVGGPALFARIDGLSDGGVPDITVLGSAPNDTWTVYAIGPAMVPSDALWAAKLTPGTPIEIAAQILDASASQGEGEPPTLVLRVRYLKLGRK